MDVAKRDIVAGCCRQLRADNRRRARAAVPVTPGLIAQNKAVACPQTPNAPNSTPDKQSIKAPQIQGAIITEDDEEVRLGGGRGDAFEWVKTRRVIEHWLAPDG